MKHYDQVFLGVRFEEERYLAEHSQDALDELMDPEATQPAGVSPVQEADGEPEQDFAAFSNEVRRLVNEINDRVGAAQVAPDSAARQHEIAAARANLDELLTLAKRHPSVELQRLAEVTELISLIERDDG